MGNSQSFGVKELILTETNDLSVSTINKFKVNLKPIPTPNISTSDTFLIYKEGTFTTPYYLGNDYLWELDGGVITAGQGTNTITVYWDTPGDKNVSVTENNGVVTETTSTTQLIPTPYISINQNHTLIIHKLFSRFIMFHYLMINSLMRNGQEMLIVIYC